MATKPVQVVDASSAEFQAAKKIAVLKKELEKAKRERDNYARHVESIEQQAEFLRLTTPEFVPYKLDKLKKGDGTTTAILVCSDWHWEENVDPKTINGLNKYNPKIAAQRIKKVWQNAAMLIDFARKFTNIDELVIALLGDHITGYIHEELMEDNWLSPTEAALQVQDHIMNGIHFLNKEVKPKRIIIPTCHGNHGRTTKKMHIATSYANSYEWLMYNQLQWHCNQSNMPNVHWKISNGYHNWLNIQGHDIRMHHGDAIRYQGGVGGITIPVNKAIAAWNKTRTADLDIFGHYHTSKEDAWWVSNGSLIGMNAFGISIKADFEEPSQSLVLMNKRRGKILTMRVFCD